jgi:DNA-binding CsgD family transcriptional regulator
MELLSDGDVRQMLGFLHEASEVEGPEAFTEPLVEAFWRLIPADGGASCIAAADPAPDVPPEARTLRSFAEVGSEWCVRVQEPSSGQVDEACLHFSDPDPIPPTPRFINRALRESDQMTRQEWQRLELCHLAGDGVQDALRLWLAVPDDHVLRRIQFASGRRGGVSDRDICVLELLIPHLIRLYQRAAQRREALPALGTLTPREHEVIRLVAHGKTNAEIARTLWISPNTVRTHLEHIFDKLGVTNRTAAAALALATSVLS